MAVQEYDIFFGATAAGGTPALTTFVSSATDIALTPPAISDIGGGFYRFSVDWVAIGASGIRWAASLAGFPDQWDEIVANPPPGVATPAARAQNLALYATAGEIISRAAVEIGLGPVADPYAASDPNIQQLCEFLRQAATRIRGKQDWEHLTLPVTFVTDGVTTSYMLPEDFGGMLADTGWNKTSRLRLAGPVTPSTETYLQATLIAAYLRTPYQIQGGLLTFPVVPPSGATISFQYSSRYWTQSAASGTPDKKAPTLSTDVVLFDPELMVAATVLRFREAKEMDTGAALLRFDEELARAIGENGSAPVLTFGGRRVGPRPIDATNVPPTGWNV